MKHSHSPSKVPGQNYQPVQLGSATLPQVMKIHRHASELGIETHFFCKPPPNLREDEQLIAQVEILHSRPARLSFRHPLQCSLRLDRHPLAEVNRTFEQMQFHRWGVE